MSQRNEPPKRLRNPNADDETGKRLVRAALELMNDGVALHDLRLADAVERASASKPDRPLSRGAAYPRFSSQADFRLAVLREILREGQGANRREGGQRLLDLLETEMSRSEPMPPKALQELIEKIGAEQIRRIAEDPLFVLRIYALKALEDGLFVGDDELVEKVRALEQDSRQQWTNLLGLLAGEYGLELRADDLRDLAHGVDREGRAGLDPVGHRVEADRGEHVPRHRPARRELEAVAQRERPARPHRIERDERAVLVEDGEIDPVEDRVEGAGHRRNRPLARRHRVRHAFALVMSRPA
jgi:hypothetical protein